jgi:hypothetical protein
MIAGDNDTDDKFFAGINNNTGEQLLPVTTALAINLLPVSTTLFGSYRSHFLSRKSLTASQE